MGEKHTAIIVKIMLSFQAMSCLETASDSILSSEYF